MAINLNKCLPNVKCKLCMRICHRMQMQMQTFVNVSQISESGIDILICHLPKTIQFNCKCKQPSFHTDVWLILNFILINCTHIPVASTSTKVFFHSSSMQRRICICSTVFLFWFSLFLLRFVSALVAISPTYKCWTKDGSRETNSKKKKKPTI